MTMSWRLRGVWKEEALDDLPWKDERARSSSISQTLEQFQRQRQGNFLETGGARMGFSEHIDTILNGTELHTLAHFKNVVGDMLAGIIYTSYTARKSVGL